MNLLTVTQFHKFPPDTRGVVVQEIAPLQPGRVEYQGTSWPACLYDPDSLLTLLPDQPVMIIGRQNLTLMVTPWHCELSSQFHAHQTVLSFADLN